MSGYDDDLVRVLAQHDKPCLMAYVWHPRHLETEKACWDIYGKVFYNRTIPYYMTLDDYEIVEAKP